MENIFWASRREERIKGKPQWRCGRGCQVQSLKQIKWISSEAANHSAEKRNGGQNGQVGRSGWWYKANGGSIREFSSHMFCSHLHGCEILVTKLAWGLSVHYLSLPSKEQNLSSFLSESLQSVTTEWIFFPLLPAVKWMMGRLKA